MKAWYFSRADRKLGFGDGRPIVLGETHTVIGPPRVCAHGLHGSKLMLDALCHAQGPIVWRVELGGELHEVEDEAAATERTYLYGGVDVSDIIIELAKLCDQNVSNIFNALYVMSPPCFLWANAKTKEKHNSRLTSLVMKAIRESK